MLSRFFRESDHLFARYAGESLEELLDRVARFQMIEQTLYRHACPSKNRLTTKNLRVLRYDAAHTEQNSMALFAAKSMVFSDVLIGYWRLSVFFCILPFLGSYLPN